MVARYTLVIVRPVSRVRVRHHSNLTFAKMDQLRKKAERQGLAAIAVKE